MLPSLANFWSASLDDPLNLTRKRRIVSQRDMAWRVAAVRRGRGRYVRRCSSGTQPRLPQKAVESWVRTHAVDARVNSEITDPRRLLLERMLEPRQPNVRIPQRDMDDGHVVS